MKNTVFYARFSSHFQNEQRIEGKAECRAFGEHNSLRITHEYIDRALTGTTDKRPEFLQMIEDSNKKLFNQVIVYLSNKRIKTGRCQVRNARLQVRRFPLLC